MRDEEDFSALVCLWFDRWNDDQMRQWCEALRESCLAWDVPVPIVYLKRRDDGEICRLTSFTELKMLA